jgi:hypothetical protein
VPGIKVAFAQTLSGPWKLANVTVPGLPATITRSICDNPSPTLRQNLSSSTGYTIYLAYRFDGKIGLIQAERPEGPWSNAGLSKGNTQLGPALNPGHPIVEDPYLWTSMTKGNTGSFHMMFHDYAGIWTGAHAFSPTGEYGTWKMSTRHAKGQGAYNTTVEFTDGASLSFMRRERPELIFGDAGEVTHLLSGVERAKTGTGSNAHQYSMSLLQPVFIRSPSLKVDDADTVPPRYPPVRAGRVVHVSPGASNATGDGTARRPFTLAGAVQALRGQAAGATVLLAGGDYFLERPLVLTAADGGTRDSPVTYRSSSGTRARLLGAVEVPAAAFRPAVPLAGSYRGMWVAELAPLLGPTRNASVLGGRGADGLKAELFVEKAGRLVPQQLAQDPNPRPDGVWRWAGHDNILTGAAGAWFLLNATVELSLRIDRWCAAANSSGFDLFGHWGDEGGVQDARVHSITPVRDAGGTVQSYNVSLHEETWMAHARGGFRVTPGERFVAVGALEFVDSAGEYWIDREALRLYYMRPADHGRTFLSVGPSLASPAASTKHPAALVQLQGVSFLTWVNITTAVSTQALFTATAVQGLQVQGSIFEGSGASCVSIDGNSSTVSNSEIAHCGGSALSISGGNWDKFGPTLFVGAELVVRNNTISDWARWERTPNSAGLVWQGVGHLVQNNILRDAPEPAVGSNGNVNCSFENNLVSNVNYEQSDMGAYYHGSSAGGYQFGWTQPGNTIRGNVWRQIRFQEQSKAGQFTSQAIYMDDELSGYTIVNNTFIDVDVGILIGGGRHHRVENNTFESCGTACIHMDNRGMNWAHELCGCQCAFNTCVPGCSNGAALGPGLAANMTAASGFRFEQGLRELHCVGPSASPPCSNAPGLEWLASVLHDDAGGGACAPAHNTFRGNRFHKIGCNPPWQVCGDPHNASAYHSDCRPQSDPNLGGLLQNWGSDATGNVWYDDGTARKALPVIPWPQRHPSPSLSFW